MKAKTIAQYKILEFLKQNFDLDCFEISLVLDSEIYLTDKQGKVICFRYENEEVMRFMYKEGTWI
jgi:hypothetical protein